MTVFRVSYAHTPASLRVPQGQLHSWAEDQGPDTPDAYQLERQFTQISSVGIHTGSQGTEALGG